MSLHDGAREAVARFACRMALLSPGRKDAAPRETTARYAVTAAKKRRFPLSPPAGRGWRAAGQRGGGGGVGGWRITIFSPSPGALRPPTSPRKRGEVKISKSH